MSTSDEKGFIILRAEVIIITTEHDMEFWLSLALHCDVGFKNYENFSCMKMIWISSNFPCLLDFIQAISTYMLKKQLHSMTNIFLAVSWSSLYLLAAAHDTLHALVFCPFHASQGYKGKHDTHYYVSFTTETDSFTKEDNKSKVLVSFNYLFPYLHINKIYESFASLILARIWNKTSVCSDHQFVCHNHHSLFSFSFFSLGISLSGTEYICPPLDTLRTDRTILTTVTRVTQSSALSSARGTQLVCFRHHTLTHSCLLADLSLVVLQVKWLLIGHPLNQFTIFAHMRESEMQ